MPGDHGPKRQLEIYVGGLRGHRPRVPVDPRDLENCARAVMTPEGFAYVTGGAGAESTVRANREALERWRIVPRVLRDVSVRDTSVDLFGVRMPSPLLLTPIGVLEMAHPEADLAVARAAAQTRVPMIFSNQSSEPLEKCAGVMGDSPRWLQLYWSKSDELLKHFMVRAEASGCSAIVVTLDVTMIGWRPRDLDLAYLPFLHGKGIAQYVSDPVFLDSLGDVPRRDLSGGINLALIKAFIKITRSFPGNFWKNLFSAKPRSAVEQFITTYARPSATWDDLAFLRKLTRLPILLKGIQHPEDGRKAIEYGMDGVIVSNHGGRQIDGALGSLDALPGVVDAVGGRVPVLFDGGIRGGADIFKALALGARAVSVGRPYVYGLAIAGTEGVREVLLNLMAEFDLTMALAGCKSVKEITRDSITRIDQLTDCHETLPATAGTARRTQPRMAPCRCDNACL
ncbi:MAG: lactate 2-monooxygenase [Planctomycetota bacterium]|nr:lactate 2-monooxygenase [Planctomycetota bacterium]